MPTSTRIKANSLSLKINGTEYMADLSSVELQAEPASSDSETFYEAGLGGVGDWFFTVSGVQSTDTASFWKAMWDAAGTEVEYIYAPHGNSTATASKPHFRSKNAASPQVVVSTVRIPMRGMFVMGGQASADGTFSFEGVRMDIIGEPFYATAA
jgi:hypothetical protein